MFATHGLPKLIVTDNGMAFTSYEFQEFITKNSISHIKTALYHPGLAERAVQTSKEGLKNMIERSVETNLLIFSFNFPFSNWSITCRTFTRKITLCTPGSAMVLLNYNFNFTLVSTFSAIKTICIPITCWRGPSFLVAWNIHVSCNLLCSMCGIAMHVIAMQGTHMEKFLTMPLEWNCFTWWHICLLLVPITEQ